MYCLDPWSHLLLFLQSSVGILGDVDNAFENNSWVADFYWFLFCLFLVTESVVVLLQGCVSDDGNRRLEMVLVLLLGESDIFMSHVSVVAWLWLCSNWILLLFLSVCVCLSVCDDNFQLVTNNFILVQSFC